MKKILSVLSLVFAMLFFVPVSTNAYAVEGTDEAAPARATNVTKLSDGDYVKVTSASELTVGRKVLIAANGYNYAMSKTQKTSNRGRVSVTKTTKDGKSVIVPSSSVGIFTLTEGYTSGTFALYDSYYGYYLSSASSSYNYLKLAKSVASYSSFAISVTSSGVATVKAQGSYSRNTIRYYSTSGVFSCYASGQKDIAIYQEYVASTDTPDTPVDTTVSVTGVTLNTTAASVNIGSTTTLTATVKPTDATNKAVTWTTSNSSVATVSNGKVTGVATGTATITATTVDGGYKASATITVVDPNPVTPENPTDPTPSTGKASWTIMMYICGADLESQNSLATSDLKEILSVANQPDDVNIIIQTGGAKSWASTYGINASYTERYHVANKTLVRDERLSKANMGLTSTFQSFLEWGLTSYPAEKTGVILWNHGGAMRGVCYDENYSSDSLLNSEVNTALTNAFANTGRTEKLEFIGYDACLMNVQDIAEFNSHFFNYMVASEESESGYGWDYDTWVDDLYSKKATSTILKAIVDGFISENGGTSSSSNDQTLSYLNLSYMEAYKNAWENMASALSSKVTSSNKSKLQSLVKSCKYYADSSYTYYAIFDAKDFVNKLAANSTFNPGTTYTNAVLTQHAKLVEYSSCGKGAGNSYGMCMFFSTSSNAAKSTYYSASQTNFTTWRTLVSSYGA